MGCDVLKKTKLNLRCNSLGSTFLSIHLSKHLSKGKLAQGILNQSRTYNSTSEKAKKNAYIKENRNQQRFKALATAQLEAEDPRFKLNFSNAASCTTFTIERLPNSFTTDTTKQDSLFSKRTGSTKGTTATSYSTQSYTQSYTQEELSTCAQAGP